MTKLNPTLGVKDTALNVKNFIAFNMDTFWNILTPLLPWIVGLHFLDFIITGLFFADSENSFGLGGLIASYFMTALVITWHRVVIFGPDNYTAMDPFKPQKHELVFIGIGILIGIAVGIASIAVIALSVLAGPIIMAVALFFTIILSVFLLYKIGFYFPAKAINNSITFRQSYELTQGYFWKLMGAGILASLKYILITIVYFLGVGVLIGGLSTLFGESVFISNLLGFTLMIPFLAFIQPILAVIGVTVLSNYFQHALQNKI